MSLIMKNKDEKPRRRDDDGSEGVGTGDSDRPERGERTERPERRSEEAPVLD
jgi:hypothetical protein